MNLRVVMYQAVGKMRNGLAGLPMKLFLGFIILILGGSIRPAIPRIVSGSFPNNLDGFGQTKIPLKTIRTLLRIKGLYFGYAQETMEGGKAHGRWLHCHLLAVDHLRFFFMIMVTVLSKEASLAI
jgi:hypothetical protein